MSGLYIRLEHEILGFDPYVSGKELSRLEPELLEPLMKFFSADPEEVAGFAEGEELEIDVPEQQWFSATEGIATLKNLSVQIMENSARIIGAEKLMRDIADFERVLSEAEKKNINWCLAVDS